MLKYLVPALCVCFAGVSTIQGQALPTASRRADLQVGVGYVYDKSNYNATNLSGDPVNLKGFAIYTTLDVRSHLGAEFVFHQASSGIGDQVYQRTYEIGPRYFRTYGRFEPYVKLMYGRGVFNFPYGNANLAYNIFVGGAGTDVRILPFLNLRADYEYQSWRNFPAVSLTPQLFTLGVAYHFPGDLKRGRHWGK